MGAQDVRVMLTRCEKCGRVVPVNAADVREDAAPHGTPGTVLYAGAEPLTCPFHGASTYWLRPLPCEDHWVLPIGIPATEIAQLLATAFEGASNYWCEIREYEGERGERWQHPGWVASHVTLPMGRGRLVLGPSPALNSDEARGWEDSERYLDRACVEQGLRLLAETQPAKFAQLLSGDTDRSCADVFLNLCVFGEVRYG